MKASVNPAHIAASALMPFLAAFVSLHAVAQTSDAFQLELASSVQMPIRPGAETPVSMTVSPRAVCTLHSTKQNNTDQSMKLFADDEGNVRFHVSARQPSTDIEKVQLDCLSEEGKASTLPIEFSIRASAAVPVEKPQAEVSRKGSTTLQALTEDEARSLSASEIAAHGYPPRPDAAVSPEAFAAWLRIVTQSHTLIRGGEAAHPSISHQPQHITAGTETTSNWNGFELRGLTGTYNAVWGEWAVPSVIPVLGLNAYSSLWVGLDGDGTNDLVQAGTEQNSLMDGFFVFTSYYAFSEIWPNQPTEHVLTNFPISPGQKVYVSVSVTDQYSNPNVHGGYLTLYLLNEATGLMYEPLAVSLGGLNFQGREAEWIMERPYVNGVPANLADYISAQVDQAEALTQSIVDENYSLSGNITLNMMNGSEVISTVAPNGSTSMKFTWHNFH